tara:strand:+ start:265 stop:1434 length:1170 start_codon:yes stop_codon:yes gene_type:complete
MANGASAPNYRLSQGTQKRVFEAGVDPTNAKSGKTARQHLTNAAIADGVDAIATGIKDQVIEKREDTATREEAWDAGFDAMDDKGGWASGELFDQFQESESSFRDEYLEAVRKGDKKGQQRMLKDQATRSSGLQGWKGTMETAKQIHDGVGWSAAFKGPANEENREIIKALTMLDGKSAVSRFGEKGEMVFDIKLKNGKTRTMTRREVDDMLAKGVKPVKQELDFMNGILKYQEDGTTGKIFNKGDATKRNAFNITNEMIPALMTEDFGGGGTFAEHIKSHPDMKAAIVDKFADTDGVDGISAEERVAMEKKINEDIDSVIVEMQKKGNEDIAIGYLAEWQAAQQETAYLEGNAGYVATQEAKRRKSLTAAERVAEDVDRRKALINEKK